MERSEILSQAEQLLELYRETMSVDPFFTIRLEVAEGDFFSQVSRSDKVALCWTVCLNPTRHKESSDIQYSVVDAVVRILCEPLSGSDHERNGVVARLTQAIVKLSATEEDDEDE